MLGGKHAICSLGLPTLADRHSGVQWRTGRRSRASKPGKHPKSEFPKIKMLYCINTLGQCFPKWVP